jgi:hypothetical protein
LERSNDLSHYHLYFSEENTKQLDQDEITEILYQAKTSDPKWCEAMVNANIKNFEISYEETFLTLSTGRNRRKSSALMIQI